MVVGKVGSLESVCLCLCPSFPFVCCVLTAVLETCGGGVMAVPQEVWHETQKVETVPLASPPWVLPSVGAFGVTWVVSVLCSPLGPVGGGKDSVLSSE